MKYINEPDNFFTHAIPAVLVIPVTGFMAFNVTSGVAQFAALLYGITMLMLFSASSLYHSIPRNDKQLLFWKKVDHSCIFLMIAGAYTPITLLVFTGTTQTALFSYIWTVALAGMGIKISGKLQRGWVSLTIYLAMGWTSIVLIKDLIEILPVIALFWMFLGGFFYSVGAYFYSKDKRKAFLPKFSYHAVWHLFVVAGAASHVYFNCKYIFKLI